MTWLLDAAREPAAQFVSLLLNAAVLVVAQRIRGKQHRNGVLLAEVAEATRKSESSSSTLLPQT
jgi:hypothetical protein